MVDENFLAERFQENRPRLRAVAYRMLGSLSESDDALQEAWLRASGADTDEVRNLQAWLTTIVGRVCLNMLRSRRQRQPRLQHQRRAAVRVVARPDSDLPETQSVVERARGRIGLRHFQEQALRTGRCGLPRGCAQQRPGHAAAPRRR